MDTASSASTTSARGAARTSARPNATRSSSSPRPTSSDADLIGLLADAKPEVVFHLAAQISVRHSVDDPQFDPTVNVVGTVRLAEAARRAGVRKVVHTSSGGSIYGTPPCYPTSEHVPDRPDVAVRGEQGRRRGLPEHVPQPLRPGLLPHRARPTSTAPARTRTARRGWSRSSPRRCCRGKPTKIFGDGTDTRDYVFVDDVVDAFVRASGEPGDGQRFNVGTGWKPRCGSCIR